MTSQLKPYLLAEFLTLEKVFLSRLSNYKAAIGPGILFASTAIGVSHLVESTRAGADYSFGLLWAILLANIFKYPFFEFGTRYATSTGKSLIEGYREIGKWMFYLYWALTFLTMFFVAAAVGAVTSGFLNALFGVSESFPENGGTITTIVLFVVCSIILVKGKYNALENLIKIVGGVLLITTLIAFVLVLAKGPVGETVSFESPELFGELGALSFVIALMGWMPTAVDLSTWNSLWTIERQKKATEKITLKQSLFDFNLGYAISIGLAVCFLILGAFMLYGTSNGLPVGKAGFAHGIIGLYTSVIGDWSYLLIAAASFSIMFGTCIAVFDGYGRSSQHLVSAAFTNLKSTDSVYKICIVITALVSLGVVLFFAKDLKFLIDLAMILSFVIAPVIAAANFYLVTGDRMKKEDQPSLWLRILAFLGILFLTLFTLLFLYHIV